MDNSSGVIMVFREWYSKFERVLNAFVFFFTYLEVKRASSLLSENTGTVMR